MVSLEVKLCGGHTLADTEGARINASIPCSTEQATYRAMGDELLADRVASMKATLNEFKSKLEEFAVRHRTDI